MSLETEVYDMNVDLSSVDAYYILWSMSEMLNKLNVDSNKAEEAGDEDAVSDIQDDWTKLSIIYDSLRNKALKTFNTQSLSKFKGAYEHILHMDSLKNKES